MYINYITYNYYEELLNDLTPNGLIYDIQNSFVYRGQGRDWPLLPSIYRTPEILKKYTMEDSIKQEYEYAYRYAEYNLLREFLINANKSGLKIPSNPFNYNDYVTNYNSTEKIIELISKEWLPDDLIPIAALAQHYGIPTRLLDWSFDINVALYFASISAIRCVINNKFIQDNETIVIWLLNSNIYKKSTETFSLKYIVPNYYENPNISAQRGLLTCWKSLIPIGNFSKIKRNDKSLDQLLSVIPNIHNTDLTDNVAMCKITMPQSEALKIFKHLSKNDYNAARLFPGYFGVAQKIEEDRLVFNAEAYFENKEKVFF